MISNTRGKTKFESHIFLWQDVPELIQFGIEEALEESSSRIPNCYKPKDGWQYLSVWMKADSD
jgi:hypothetical protein